jgi:hypothetical protein
VLPAETRDRKLVVTDSQKEGQCIHCGVKKLFPAVHWKMRTRNDSSEVQIRIGGRQTSKVDVQSLPAVTDFIPNWDMALDALMHLGGGGEAYLSAVAASIDPSALFRHVFTSALEDLSHIDVARDEDAQVVGWEINPSFAVEINGGFQLLGYWPKSSKHLMKEYFGGKFQDSRRTDSVSRHTIVNVTPGELIAFCEEQGIDVNVVPSPALNMISALPGFFSAIHDLPEKSLGLFEEVNRYDPLSNSWLPGDDFEGEGGYRLKSAYKTEYCVVTEESFKRNTMKSVSSSTAKHFESLTGHSRPLFGYAKSDKQLFVPVGAPLPGLYARSAVLESGSLPVLDSTGSLLVYQSISLEYVKILTQKMGERSC